MTDATIRFFPVGNGNCTLLWVGETRILIDLSPRIKSGDPHFDVDETREALLPLVRRSDGRHVVDAFILSHPDKDHLLDAEELLHLGLPDEYDSDREKMLVEEIIYAPASFDAVSDELSEDGQAVQREIERRLESDERAGNKVTALLGKDDEDPGADRAIFAGDTIESFGVSGSDDRISALVYAPRSVLDPANRNEVSAVIQLRVTPSGTVNPVRIILGGDAPREVWEDIHAEEDLEEFKYDLLLTPHHCSWSVFADSSDEAASVKVVELFEHRQEEAKVVASSFAIHIDRTPPSENAAAIYKHIVGEANFYCTGEYPDGDALEPIVFEITDYGVSLLPSTEGNPGDVGETAAVTGAIRRTPQKYGGH